MKTKIIISENVQANPEYQKIELKYVLSQQKIAEALTVIESVPLQEKLKNKLINTLASSS